MSLSRRLVLLNGAIFLTRTVCAAGDVETQDIQAFRDWINSKRMITVRELGGQLSISGDVHAELQSTSMVKNGKAERGGKGKDAHNLYDVEFNLMVDYRTDRSWLASRLRFDNDAGITTEHVGSGKTDKIKLDRAYWGYRLLDGDRHTMDLEIGRRGAMTVLFDSRLMFGVNFDGLTFKDSYAVDNVGDLYYQLGAFIVNEKHNQAAYGGEAGILNIANTGFYTKYSFIDWDTKDNVKFPKQFHFIVSHLLLGYKWIPQILDRPVVIYWGNLYNHRARGINLTRGKKANYGGYLGFTLGALKLAGDWSLDMNYQLLQAQAIPDFDVSGIGMGSKAENSFYTYRNTAVTNRRYAEGNVNYRGFEITLQYLISNNLNFWQQWRQSITLDNHIGPHRRYKQYEIDFIYSF